MLIDRLACFEFPGGTADAGDMRFMFDSGSPGEDLLEKEMQPTPVFLAGQRSLVGYKSMGSQRV